MRNLKSSGKNIAVLSVDPGDSGAGKSRRNPDCQVKLNAIAK